MALLVNWCGRHWRLLLVVDVYLAATDALMIANPMWGCAALLGALVGLQIALIVSR